MSHEAYSHDGPGAVVRVRIDEDQQKAGFTPKRVSIESGDRVRWRFSGVPEGYQPLLRFKGSKTGSSQRLGDGVISSSGFGDGETRYNLLLVPLSGGRVVVLEGIGWVESHGMGVDKDCEPVGGNHDGDGDPDTDDDCDPEDPKGDCDSEPPPG